MLIKLFDEESDTIFMGCLDGKIGLNDTAYDWRGT